MKKNYLKIIAIFLGIFLALFIVANFGINYWLKSQLPKYVKNNSHYLISYKTLDVDIATETFIPQEFQLTTKILKIKTL